MMQPDEVRKDLANQWFAKGDSDLSAAQILVQANPALVYPACFHAQQAIEKYCKGFLTWHQIEFPKTHDLLLLQEIMATKNNALADRLEGVARLNPYGVEIRYPGEMPEPDINEAKMALDLAVATCKLIKNNLE